MYCPMAPCLRDLLYQSLLLCQLNDIAWLGCDLHADEEGVLTGVFTWATLLACPGAGARALTTQLVDCMYIYILIAYIPAVFASSHQL